MKINYSELIACLSDKFGALRMYDMPEGYVKVSGLDELKTNKTMEKKIEGYICPEDLFNGEIKKGTMYSEGSMGYGIYYPVGKKSDVIALYAFPKEVVRWWEPVYVEGKTGQGDGHNIGMSREDAENLINNFQGFLTSEGQLDISLDQALKNRDRFLDGYLPVKG